MATADREARRRKIVDRGSDRLAFISGRIQSLSSSSSPPKPQDQHTDLLSQSLMTHAKDPEPHVPNQTTVSHKDDKVSNSSRQKNDSSPVTDISATAREISLEPPLFNREMSSEALGGSVSADSQQSAFPTLDSDHFFEPQTRHTTIFTPNQINSAIAASASSRLYASVAIAILVVLSNLGFPLLGSNFIKSIINSRPLYLLLITNLTIVLASLKQRAIKSHPRGANGVQSTLGGHDWAVHVSKGLEVGSVLQKVTDAVFMDFGVYAIIIVSGLSLFRQFDN